MLETTKPTTVPIDQTSVRRNPHAGCTVIYRALKPYTTGQRVFRKGKRWWWLFYYDGIVVNYTSEECITRPLSWPLADVQATLHQPVEEIHCLSQPPWLFSFVPTPVQCDTCGWRGLHTELVSADFDDDDNWGRSDEVCPKCGCWRCCAIKFEQPDYQAWDRQYLKTKEG